LREFRHPPAKELKGFQRIALNAGETRMVTLEMTPVPPDFGSIDIGFVVEAGEFLVMVGPNSADLQSTALNVEA
jgi:beta-glucosidase